MKFCGLKAQALTAIGIAGLNFIFAKGTFGLLFACADMWGKCTPSRRLTLSNEILSFPLSAFSAREIFPNASLAALFMLNASAWGLASFVLMRIACHALRT